MMGEHRSHLSLSSSSPSHLVIESFTELRRCRLSFVVISSPAPTSLMDAKMESSRGRERESSRRRQEKEEIEPAPAADVLHHRRPPPLTAATRALATRLKPDSTFVCPTQTQPLFTRLRTDARRDFKVTYHFFHWKKGTPFADALGIYNSWWEQIDNGRQLTRNRKFLIVCAYGAVIYKNIVEQGTRKGMTDKMITL